MIYFDNAATSAAKPSCVTEAFLYYLDSVGANPGRGCYDSAVQAGRMLYTVRKKAAAFFGTTDASNVVFTKNSTEALNLLLRGLLTPGSHILISPYEHNAVLRPAETLRRAGIIEYDVIPERFVYDPDDGLETMIHPNTRLICAMFAGNLTGQYVFSRRLSAFAHAHGVPVLVDASQGAGQKLINMKDDGIDYLAFTGHKDLLGLPGTGGLVSLEPLRIAPLLQGGTGILGEEYVNPDEYPESYEAGTVNMPAIWALGAALDYISSNSESIRLREDTLIRRLICGLKAIGKVRVYNADRPRVPTVCFTADGFSPNEIAERLNEHGICVRSGMHCAVLAHKAIGTDRTGAVRISLGYMNTETEIDAFLGVLEDILK